MPNAFYGILSDENSIILDKNETAHLKIVRINIGEEITVYDGTGNIYTCIVEKISKNQTKCRVLNIQNYNKEYKPEIDFYIGASKFDRMKILIEKLVELRVNRIHIFHGKKSQLTFKNLEKFKKVIIESSKQSENPKFPEISFTDFKKINKLENAILLDLKSSLSLNEALSLEYFKKNKKISVILGPDMGFSNDELENVSNNIIKVNLGKTTMRFETAGIYVMSILNYFYNRLY
ncbi:hypothetical protein XO10_00895 [Marinitoga sp. 1135]|uniref:Ribosomal RNA small subunit methyltransferase E n=1 Tax=Marinitoga piezophila (strain DSM 14283 / JCM 11233 / KA3) TaxID=443254 RepID=H2J359_MARPK|nr:MULTISPECIES: RsmE family RNA methyltransferase [Marinitoga]AEX84577.1 RNA methyltransferase, RsmE family [Marinitoga piezophila KA3]APT75097.1 hypothetical protein LN42_00835 [Marinitoga sp. 1137]NUU94870.1 hypothetical protein [Marinitoga sp. 1135]NUU96808.1 hypothetical protein [Marinitoga sp. 1138]